MIGKDPLIGRRELLKAGAVGLGCIAWGGLPQRLEAAYGVGEAPAKIALNDLHGRRVVVPSDFKGQVLLLHFWASWCITCRGEMTALESVYMKYGRRGVVPCSIDLGEGRDVVAAHIQKLKISYPVLLDPGSATRKIFRVAGIPTYYVLDRAGIIKFRILGKADREGLDRMIRSLL